KVKRLKKKGEQQQDKQQSNIEKPTSSNGRELETLEWDIEGLSIKFLWDPNSKHTYYCSAPEQSYPIQYVSNPQGIIYFLYIPLQTIAVQCDNKQSLDSTKYAAAQPMHYRIRTFTDGQQRSAQITIQDVTYSMDIQFEIILSTIDRPLGKTY